MKRVTIDTKINKFILKGTLSTKDLTSLVNFNTGYNVLILKLIKDLLLKYKNTVDSEEKLLEEYKGLYNAFDEIFNNTILIRYALENLLLDK